MIDVESIRRAINKAPPADLHVIHTTLSAAWGAAEIDDAAYEALDGLIRLRQAGRKGEVVTARRTSVGSRPRTPESLQRRRDAFQSGELPKEMRSQLTPGEAAVLIVIGREVKRGGECKLAMDAIAALAGVCKTIAKRAVRIARESGWILVEARKKGHRRNDTNIIRVIAPEWVAWMRLGSRQRARCAQAVVRALTQGTFVTATTNQSITEERWGSPHRDSRWTRDGVSMTH